jgi:biopolymer transport protein ExbB
MTPIQTPASSIANRGLPRAGRAFAALLLSLMLTPVALADSTAPAQKPAVQAETPAATPVDPAAAPTVQELTPASAPTDPAEPAAEDNSLGMSHDLSPWGMYKNADIIVKAVMIGLAKGFELLGAKRRLRGEIAALKRARNLDEASAGAKKEGTLSHLLVHDAMEEMRLSVNTREREGIKERVAFRLERLVAACGRNMSMGTGVLATIGSTAPFVGLFGTVWGIMNSFIGIAKTQTTNLAVVAPGIAEALLATALGLVAAIPAVVIYNVFARSIAGYKAQVSDASAQVLLLVSRDLDHQPAAERSQPPHMVKMG